jgi:hypothetical protein
MFDVFWSRPDFFGLFFLVGQVSILVYHSALSKIMVFRVCYFFSVFHIHFMIGNNF